MTRYAISFRPIVMLLTLILSSIPITSYSQSIGRNYILARTFTDSIGKLSLDSVYYYDCLGRLEQTILRNASLQGEDIVTLQEYDLIGRPSNRWNPVGIQGNEGLYVASESLTTRAVSFYKDTHPYSKPVYEASPLSRIREEYGPGKDWHTRGRSVKTEYLINVAGNDSLHCLCYETDDSSNDTLITLSCHKEYASSQLSVVRREDEDGNTTFEFTDKSEQLLLIRQILQNSSGRQQLDTYFLYNELGDLSAVLPPLASAALKSSAASEWRSDTCQTLNQYAFLYKYNSRRLPIAKKLPGCQWAFFVYDRADRLILTQDGNSRLRGEWHFTLPDALGRECISGTCTNTWEAFSDPFKDKVITVSRTMDTEAVAEEENKNEESFKGYKLSGITLHAPTVQSVNYYDDYSFLGRNGLPAASDKRVAYDGKAEEEGFGKCYTASAHGLLTGTLTACLNSLDHPSYTYQVNYYDAYARPVQIQSNSHQIGGYEQEYIGYNFTGQPVKRKHVHSYDGKSELCELYTFTYDPNGRLLTASHSLNNDSAVTLVSNEYDAVGRTIRNKRNGNESLYSSYGYNVRSWMNEINGPFFRQQLYYNEPTAEAGSKPQYNGSISAMNWSGEKQARQAYHFFYDNLSRLTEASYLENGQPNNHFSTSYRYDMHGNMLNLKRNGLTANNRDDMLDDLSFTYKGNQLADCMYDANGNQIIDKRKGISEMAYNHLNLPSRITFDNGNSITYLYDAAGTKRQTRHVTGTDTLVTDYCGKVMYENGIAKTLLVDGGYVALSDRSYHFFIHDHQGNVRVVADKEGKVEERNDYYPFGGLMASSTTSAQPYKYNGKELDSKNGLNWYDYGARHYDPVIGRWKTMDPLAEMYYSWSPYVYCKDNPVNRIDPDGKDDYVIGKDGRINRLSPRTNIDVLYAFSGDDNNPKGKNYVVMQEQGLLEKLVKKKAQNQNNKYFTKSSNLFDAANLFQFVAENTTVEWYLSIFESDNKHTAFIVTNRQPYRVNYGNEGEYMSGKKKISNHSHPDPTGTRGGYGNDLINANPKVRNFVYFQASRTFYEYNKTKSNIGETQVAKKNGVYDFIKKLINNK